MKAFIQKTMALISALLWLVASPAYAQKVPTLYKNLAQGWQISGMDSFQVDNSIQEVRTRFFRKDMTVDIYHDNFYGRPENADVYQNYSSRSFWQSPHYTPVQKSTLAVAGKSARLYRYARPALRHIPNDQPYYAIAEIRKNAQEVYTVQIKANRPDADFAGVLRNFNLTAKSKNFLSPKKFTPVQRALPEPAHTFYQRHLADKAPLQFGIFEPTAPAYFSKLEQYEKELGYRFDVLTRYLHLPHNVPSKELQEAKAKGKVVQLTLQTTDQGKDKTIEILRGDYDAYFQEFAHRLQELQFPVLLRINNEMNGEWCGYNAMSYARDADLSVALYRYIHKQVTQAGADQVLFVWNPNEKSFPDFGWNHALAYFPGQEMVDVVGLTGYNTGNYYPGEHWRSFDQIYRPLYQSYSERFAHPLIITEFASSSRGGDKAAWIEDMFRKLPSYPRIRMALWWSGTDWDKKVRARPYRLDESKEVMDAFARGLQSLPSPSPLLLGQPQPEPDSKGN